MDGEISPSEFSEQYEPTCNFELEAPELAEGEATIFERVFDVVGWYTPVVKDREAYPRTRGFRIGVTQAQQRLEWHLARPFPESRLDRSGPTSASPA